MIIYLIRRILFAIPILFGINLLVFTLFFIVNSPDDMARMQLGQKYVSDELISIWKKAHGYDLPLFYNEKADGTFKVTNTLFVQKSLKLFLFDFGLSDTGGSIRNEITTRMWPSLSIAFPAFFIGIFFEIMLAMLLVLFYNTWFDKVSLIMSIALMSISTLFYIIFGQYLLGRTLKLFPISGYDGGLQAIRFVMLPIMVFVVSNLGGGIRWYRTLFLEEMHKEYVRAARARGLSEGRILIRHVFPNMLLPLLTGVVVIIPALFMGSLLLESFFGVPGLGSYLIDAINAEDFAVVRSMVFLGSVLYIFGLIVTDISYAWADPRVRFH